MRKILSTLLCCMVTFVGLAQQRTVSGTVAGEDGVSIPGVTVIVKGSTTGTVTDVEGHYTIQAASNDVLSYSYIGMETVEKTASSTTLNVMLKATNVKLEGVVAIGYGTSDVKDLTAPIITVGTEDLTKRSVQNPLTALQGQVAGLNIVGSGVPGESPSIRIRGIGSLEGGNDPLYVVDGMFMDNINYLNADDIESMSILKDASSSAIYGVRASGGVIVVITKQGKKDQKPVVTYNGYYGFQTASQRMEMANTKQYVDYQLATKDAAKYQQMFDDAISAYGSVEIDGRLYPNVSTDWYDELLENTTPIQSHNLSVVGGSKKVSYAFGASLFQQEGITINTDEFTRYNLRGKVDADLSDLVKVGANMIIARTLKEGATPGFDHAFHSPSFFPAYDSTFQNDVTNPEGLTDPGSVGLGASTWNPLVQALWENDKRLEKYRVLPSFYVEFDFLKNDKLVFKSNLMQELSFSMYNKMLPIRTLNQNYSRANTELTKTYSNTYNYTWNNVLTYAETKGKHRYSAMGGIELRENNYRLLEGFVNGVPDGDSSSEYIDLGNQTTESANDEGTTIRGLSFFTRMSYTFNDRYLATATLRADGTSKWGESDFGYFPSLGLGWIVSEENFMNNAHYLDYFKIRGSYGVLGNENVPAEAGSRTVSRGDAGNSGNSGIFNGNIISGTTITDTYSTIDWEKIEEFNIGFDARLFSNRLNLTFDWYNRTTPNMVTNFVLPNNLGTIKDNFGEMKNTGVDLSAGWFDKKGDFSYGMSGTMSFMNNEITNLGGQPFLNGTDVKQRHYVGQAYNGFYGFVVEGVYQNEAEIADRGNCVWKKDDTEPGDFKYKDINGDGKISSEDRTIIGSPLPDFNYGINLNLAYKNLELSLAFYGVHGNEIYNKKRLGTSKFTDRNIDADVANNFWVGEGSTNQYASAAGFKKTRNGMDPDQVLNTFFIEDGSYFKIQNIQLAYNLPKTWMSRVGMTNCRVYVNADNPYSFFKYNGFSPEIGSSVAEPIAGSKAPTTTGDGIDLTTYPMTATYTLGLNITF